MLVAMAGFLTAGLAIPHSFGRDGVAFGLGYLTVVLVHAWLYFRVNKNIIRLAPFNVASALLVIIAGLVARQAGSPGWPATCCGSPRWRCNSAPRRSWHRPGC